SYSFVTHWKFAVPIDQVWAILNAPESYPEWWPCIVSYRNLTPGKTGVGARGERVVKGRLPYTLRYTTTITAHDPPREIAYDSEGELGGKGRFVLEPDGTGTRVTFHWDVATTGLWMNLLAPALRPLFARNHDWVMAQGEKGLAERLART